MPKRKANNSLKSRVVNNHVPKSKCSIQNSVEMEEHRNYYDVNIIPDPEDSGESDENDLDVDTYEEDNNLILPEEPFDNISLDYNCNKKKK